MITFLLVEGGEGTAPAYRLVKVRENSVMDTTCPESTCPKAMLRDVRQVFELFKLVNEEAPGCVVKVTYHADFHFPNLIRRACDGVASPKSYTLIVTGFSPMH